MGRGPAIRKIDYSFTAKEVKTLGLTGGALLVKSLTGSLQFRLDRGDTWTAIEENFKFILDDAFTTLEFKETAGATASLTILYGRGNVEFAGTAITNSVKVLSGDTIGAAQVTVGVAATEIVAADGDRNEVTIRNLDTVEDVYLGPAGVTTGTGMLLKAGESITLKTGAAIYGIRGGASDVNVAYLEVTE